MKKYLIYILIIVLIIGGVYLYKNNNEKENHNDNSNDDENKTTNVVKDTKCINEYECIVKDNKKYYFSNKTSISVNNMYNYVTDEMEAGSLKIEDGTLKFIGLDNKVLKVFDNVQNAKYIESNGICSETYYVVLTSDNKVYRTDINLSLFLEEPFYQIELDYDVKGISLNNGDNTCVDKLTIMDDKTNIKELND